MMTKEEYKKSDCWSVAFINDCTTNGDMIKAMFPHAKIRTDYYTYCVEVKLEYHSQYDTGLLFDKTWWNKKWKLNII